MAILKTNLHVKSEMQDIIFLIYRSNQWTIKMKTIEIIHKQPLSGYLVSECNQKNKKLIWVQARENTAVIMNITKK